MGAGGSTWLQRKVRRVIRDKAAQFAPPNVAGAASKKAKQLRNRLTSAVGEGKSAMVDREAELRTRLGSKPRRSGSPK